MTGLSDRVETYLHSLCRDIDNRRVGSAGNRAATEWFAHVAASFGFEIERRAFDCIDWTHGEVTLTTDGYSFEVFASPYSLGCRVNAPLVVASSAAELESAKARDKLLLVRGEIAQEQLMPKNFSFYNPDEHKRIVSLLEAQRPAAIIAAPSRNPSLAGGLYPYPLIEDGDFDIPSVYMTEDQGLRLAERAGRVVSLIADARRIPAKSYNVIARKQGREERRVVFCAHIDAKLGTSGALDNATGVSVLLLLAELLADYAGRLGVEIVPLNGEDYYAAPGQMQYLRENQDRLGQIVVAVNLDGAGYVRGNTAYSLYDCPPEIATAAKEAFSAHAGIVQGPQWYQGDHMLFVMSHRPAIAITSENAMYLSTEITHTAKDTPDLVDSDKLVHVSQALRDLVDRLR